MARVRGVVGSLVLGAVLAVAMMACSPDQAPGTPSTTLPTAAATSPADPTPAGPAQEVHVTLGIYSGRPDPTWTLTSAEAAAIERAIAALPEATGRAPEGASATTGSRSFEAGAR